VPVQGQERLLLIPGHVGLAEDEVSLGIAQQLSETVQTLRNLPGSFHYLFEITAAHYHADYVLVDLSPGLGAINQNLVSTSDYFIVPASPDVFSVMAIDSLSRVLPGWVRWAQNAAQLEALMYADYPFPTPGLKFLGTIVQRYRLRSGEPTEAFRKYFDELDLAISTSSLRWKKPGCCWIQSATIGRTCKVHSGSLPYLISIRLSLTRSRRASRCLLLSRVTSGVAGSFGTG